MKTVPSFSTSDLSRRAGDVVTAALRTPVILTRHDKPRLIVLSIEEYELITKQKITGSVTVVKYEQAPPKKKKKDPRTVGLLAEMPADLVSGFREAARAYMDREDT